MLLATSSRGGRNAASCFRKQLIVFAISLGVSAMVCFICMPFLLGDRIKLGICAFAAGLSILLTFCFVLLDSLSSLSRNALVIEPPYLSEGLGFHRTTHLQAFGDSLHYTRCLKVAWLAFRIGLNANRAYALIAIIIGPESDPIRMFLASYDVSFLLYLIARTTMNLGNLAFNGGSIYSGGNPNTCKYHVQLLASWSLIKMLGFLKPSIAAGFLKRAFITRGIAMGLAKLTWLLVGVPLGCMSLLLRTKDIAALIPNSLLHIVQLSLQDILQLAAFLNSIASIMPPPEEVRMDGVLAFLIPCPIRRLQWMEEFSESLVQGFGTCHGFLLCMTLTATDLVNVLNDNSLQEASSSSQDSYPAHVVDSFEML